MAKKDKWEFVEDFFGSRIFSVTQADDPFWRIDLLASAVVPLSVTPSSSGEVSAILQTNDEAQGVNIYQSDILQYDFDKIREVEFRLKMNQAAVQATTSAYWGIATARNDAPASIDAYALFNIKGATDTSSVVIDMDDDDGGNDEADVATGQVQINVYRDYKISFATGTNDLRFFIDGQPVGTGTTFNMSAYTGSLQLYVQIQKSGGAAVVDGITVDRISIRGSR